MDRLTRRTPQGVECDDTSAALEKLARWVPPGFPLKRELTFYGWAAALSLLWSLRYLPLLSAAKATMSIPENMSYTAPDFLFLV